MPRGGQLSISTSSVIDRPGPRPAEPRGFHRPLRLSVLRRHRLRRSAGKFAAHFSSRSFTPKELDQPRTGLGLATVYGIVKQHQGWIEVSSQLNLGTTFQIFLPACSERSGTLSASPGEQRVIGGTETLLVVEDEAPLLKLMDHILGSYGYEVLGCSSG